MKCLMPRPTPHSETMPDAALLLPPEQHLHQMPDAAPLSPIVPWLRATSPRAQRCFEVPPSQAAQCGEVPNAWMPLSTHVTLIQKNAHPTSILLAFAPGLFRLGPAGFPLTYHMLAPICNKNFLVRGKILGQLQDD